MGELAKGIAAGLIAALIIIVFYGWHLNRQDRLALERYPTILSPRERDDGR